MSHRRWVSWGNRDRQSAPDRCNPLDERRVAQDEGVDEPGPSLEATDATAARTPAADGPFGGVVDVGNIGMFGLVTIERPVVRVERSAPGLRGSGLRIRFPGASRVKNAILALRAGRS